MNANQIMKGNQEKALLALNATFSYCSDLEDLNNELYTIAVNDRQIYSILTKDNRVRVHSLAFRALTVGGAVNLEKGYYISNEHAKKWILLTFGVDYKTALAQVCEMLQTKRKEALGY